MDKCQEEFREMLAQSPLVDLETRDGWFTRNNKWGGEKLISSCIDIFLVSKTIAVLQKLDTEHFEQGPVLP